MIKSPTGRARRKAIEDKFEPELAGEAKPKIVSPPFVSHTTPCASTDVFYQAVTDAYERKMAPRRAAHQAILQARFALGNATDSQRALRLQPGHVGFEGSSKKSTFNAAIARSLGQRARNPSLLC